MKYVATTALMLIVGFVGLGAKLGGMAGRQSPNPAAARVPVIVELFTSEGCSSCPPADSLLARLEQQQPVANAQVIGLEEHVDYWDQLGWKDPFSSADWTARQYVYAGLLGNGTPYTPEMVVDGQAEFVGSREGMARQAIERAAESAQAKVELIEIASKSSKTATFSVKVEKPSNLGPRDAAEVFLAITESGLHSAVTRGENAGENLHHASVLRELERIGQMKGDKEIAFSAQPQVRLDSTWKRENLRAVVFLQEKKSKRILGAATVPVLP